MATTIPAKKTPPELFTDLGDASGIKLTTILARLHARYGTD
jgi:hypothetical protein